MNIALDISRVNSDLKETVRKKYGSLVSRIILFGSHAKGTSSEDSDFDYLIVFKDDYDWKLKKSVQDLIYEIDLKYEIVTDIKTISEKELTTYKGSQPFIQSALSEGVVL